MRECKGFMAIWFRGLATAPVIAVVIAGGFYGFFYVASLMKNQEDMTRFALPLGLAMGFVLGPMIGAGSHLWTTRKFKGDPNRFRRIHFREYKLPYQLTESDVTKALADLGCVGIEVHNSKNEEFKIRCYQPHRLRRPEELESTERWLYGKVLEIAVATEPSGSLVKITCGPTSRLHVADFVNASYVHLNNFEKRLNLAKFRIEEEGR